MSEKLRALIAGLIEDERAHVTECRAILDRAKTAGRDLTPIEQSDYDTRSVSAHDLANRIQELNTQLQEEEVAEQSRQFAPGPDQEDPRMTAFTEPGFKSPYTSRKAPAFVSERVRSMSDEETFLRGWLTGREPQNVVELDFRGLEALRGEDGRWEIRDLLSNSNLVGSDFRSVMYEHMVASNVMMRAGATILNTDHGRNIVVPKTTVGGTAAIVGEGTAIAEADGGFGSTTLGAWKHARLQQVSVELAEDTEVPLIEYLGRDLGRSAGLSKGAHFMTGTGTNQALGLMVAAGTSVAGTVASGVDADELISMVYSIAEPYRESSAWFMNDSTYAYIRKLKDGDLAYRMGPLHEAGKPNILGFPVHTDPSIAALGSANESIAFGDPRAYFVRQGPIHLKRDDSFAFDKDLITLKITDRNDGDLVDLTGAIKVYSGD